MTKDQIKAIAKDYAMQNLPAITDEILKHQVTQLNSEQVFEPFLRFLNERYYIVEREKVEQMVNDVMAISFPIRFGPVKQKVQVIATEMIKSDIKMVFGAGIFDESDEKQCFETNSKS